MAGLHHWCNGHELGQTSGDDEGQGGLVCCNPQGYKKSDTTGWLKNNHRGHLENTGSKSNIDLQNVGIFH